MKKIIAIILFITALAILIGLGSWQIQRLSWKKDVISQLKILYADDPKTNHYGYADLQIEGEDLPIMYGSIKGVFHYDGEILLGPRPYNDEIGYAVITPLQFDTGEHIFVNRGFITIVDQDKIRETHQSGRHHVWGLIRKPDWNSFTPNNSPENDIWSKLDVTEIAEAKNIADAAPYILYAEGSAPPFDMLMPQNEKWMPRNKHVQYALFWFAMAVALSGVFGLFTYKNVKKNEKSS